MNCKIGEDNAMNEKDKKTRARMLDRCAKKAVNALMEICSDQGQKASDRIAAAKPLLELGLGQWRASDGRENELRILIEGLEDGFCE